jgi:hypothetical protein
LKVEKGAPKGVPFVFVFLRHGENDLGFKKR